MGYKLDDNMRTSLCIDALKMALKNRKYPGKKLIHHSDRGIQYCNPTYTLFAESNGLTMSMTEKYEYGLKLTIKNTKLANKITKRAINIYNNSRPHLSLDLHTPKQVHINQNIDYKSYRKNKNKLELLTL